MNKENHSQLELFAQAKGYSQQKSKSSNPFLRYVWTYEKTILLIIGFIITSVISFSLGVEKGRKATVSKVNSQIEIVNKIEPSTPKPNQLITQYQRVSASDKITKRQTIEPSLITTVNTKEINKPLVIDKQAKGYTIQVATYQTKAAAQKETETLRKQGFSSIVLSKGSFNIVCVGNFTQKNEAESFLSKLKRQYQDCYIRRL